MARRLVLAAVVAALLAPAALAGQRAQSFVDSAIAAAKHTSACRPVPEHVPRTNAGAPPAALLAIMGVLRRPARAPVQGLRWRLVTGLYLDVDTRTVRLAREAFGVSWYVFVAGPTIGPGPLADLAACQAAESAAFTRERVPSSLRGEAAQDLATALEGQRVEQTFAQQAYARPLALDLHLVPLPTQLARNLGGVSGGTAPLVGGQPPTGAEAVTQGTVSEGIAANGRSIVGGVVPDGVATVTAHFPAPRSGAAVTVTAYVTNNVYVLPAPARLGPMAYPTSTTWRDPAGRTVPQR